MPGPLGDEPSSPRPEPPSGSRTDGATGHLSREETVRLAYQLVLGREPENDQVLIGQANFNNVWELRNRFMASGEFQNLERFSRIADLMYDHVEASVRNQNNKFDDFLSADPALEARIHDIIRDDTAGPDEGRNEYTKFHAIRFFDQVRAVVAIRRKLLSSVPRPRVLEIGASPVTPMYAKVLDDIDLFTADLPANEPSENIARRFGATEHYFVNLDVDALSERYPQLVRQPFHIILFCEVIE